MRSSLSIWVIPGVLTVLIGTAAAMQLSKPSVEADLTSRSAAALQSAGYGWANVRFDGRDAELSGAPASQSEAEEAANMVAQLRGVRIVNVSAQPAPLSGPYPFAATIAEGSITLTGGAPDQAARASLLEKVGLDESQLEIIPGVEDRATWLTAADYALRQLQQLDQGDISLSGMQLSIAGRAKSRVAYDTLAIVLDAGLPRGVERGDIKITPPLESPYEWRADLDNDDIVITGFVPDDQAAQQISASVADTAKISSSALPASGAPEKFTQNASILLENLALLERGTAEINDARISFSGTPRSAEDAVRIRAALAPLNAQIDLTPVEAQDTSQDTSQDSALETAQNDAITPPLPLLNQLATPPQLPGASQESAPTQAAPDTPAIVTPELPNLSALAQPPQIDQLETAEPPATERVSEPPQPEAAPQPDTAANAGSPDSTTAGAPSETADQKIETPALPNVGTLATPPQIPQEQPDVSVSADSNGESAAQQAVEKPEESERTEVAALPKKAEPDPLRDHARTTLCQNLVTAFQEENSILFPPASSSVTDASAEPLDRLAVFLKQCPYVEVYVEGHTDSDGPEDANLALSVSRAETVVTELIARGIDARRLYAVGYGESVPLEPNTTRAGKQRNRRIEFEIIETRE